MIQISQRVWFSPWFNRKRIRVSGEVLDIIDDAHPTAVILMDKCELSEMLGSRIFEVTLGAVFPFSNSSFH